MNARFYVSGIGRFASADTIVPDPANPQSLNRYTYVLNSPLRFVDPTGHWYYDPACDCLVQTKENYNEYPEYLSIPTAEAMTNNACSIACWLETYEQQSPVSTDPNINTGWPAWTYSRWFPDYGRLQVTVLILSFGITVDDYSNYYFSFGGNLGVDSPLASARLTGGWVFAGESESDEWSFMLGKENSPQEDVFDILKVYHP